MYNIFFRQNLNRKCYWLTKTSVVGSKKNHYDIHDVMLREYALNKLVYMFLLNGTFFSETSVKTFFNHN